MGISKGHIPAGKVISVFLGLPQNEIGNSRKKTIHVVSVLA